MARYDIIVIGGGHAGVEAARASSQMGLQIAVITFDALKLGAMSCNPSLGGLAKSHLIKEIDALGGIMAKAGDDTALQYRILNRRKGAAVQATRTQNDRLEYQQNITKRVNAIENIEIIEDEAIDIIIVSGNVNGVICKEAGAIYSKTVIVAAGTFLKGKIHWGDEFIESGRRGDPSSNRLSESLQNLGFEMRRFKTGTPARIIKNTVDFNKMSRQEGDDDYFPLSLFKKKKEIEDIPCWLLYTNEETHRIIRENLENSALYGGKIDAVSTRYCPSVEDKIVRFAHHPKHQLVLEPEGKDHDFMYLNGFSNSLPIDVQDRLLLTLPGLQDAKIAEYAYAIEYDVIDTSKLKRTLESREFSNLYFAGQINGTSGYEEAGSQGLVAGINAAASILDMKSFIPLPEESYAGVMLRDLTTKGVKEPYRLFTSRAEFRLLLREDNAHRRLYEYAIYYNLLDDKDREILENKLNAFKSELARIKKTRIVIPELKNKSKTVFEYFKLPDSSYDKLENVPEDIDRQIKRWIEIEAKYSGYISKEKAKISRLNKMMGISIPKDIDYSRIGNLSNETIEKLRQYSPRSLRELSGIPGVSIAHIMALGNYIMKHGVEE
ncbi:MAG: tRNA uridine-5-carboxymethylaminomethyl(34) synthesis enzyme MnmG [Candidatus Zixiibacteriota bacterium]